MKNSKQQEINLSQANGICLACGFCCDGTLFDNAVLEPDERPCLPQRIAGNYCKCGDLELFSLPCPCFDGDCSIYHNHKPQICSAYFCQLCREVSRRRMSRDHALRIIRNAKTLREEISGLYSRVMNTSHPLTFRQILTGLTQPGTKAPSRGNPQLLPLLIAKTIIFNALLTRHFKPQSEFRHMITPSGTSELCPA